MQVEWWLNLLSSYHSKAHDVQELQYCHTSLQMIQLFYPHNETRKKTIGF